MSNNWCALSFSDVILCVCKQQRSFGDRALSNATSTTFICISILNLALLDALINFANSLGSFSCIYTEYVVDILILI